MADLDKPESEEIVEDVQEEVETGNAEDENNDVQDETEDQESQDQEQEDESEEEGDEPKPEDEEESQFQKRFTQIKGENLEEYKTNLEEAYRNSSTEAQRLNTELKEKSSELDRISAAIKADPKLADLLDKALGDEKLSVQREDPALEWAKTEMKKTLDAEYNSFTDDHPEMATDEDLREEVLEELATLADAYAAKGKKLGMREGLDKAWRLLGKDSEDSKETTITKAKELAGKPAVSGKTKTSKPKSGLSDEQIAYAKRYGIDPEQLAANNK